MSERPSRGSPDACSGLMYSGVPTIMPSLVSDLELGFAFCAACAAFAMPKSVTNTWPLWSSRMLSGLMSRWTISWVCAYASASATCRAMRAASPTESFFWVSSSWRSDFCRRCWRASRSMAVQQARIARRVLLVASVLFLVWLFGVWPPLIWWRDHQPRCTAMMRLRADVQSCRPVARQMHDGTSPRRHDDTHVLERMVIIAEDSRFKTHHGIDFIELRDAWTSCAHRGAITITQQLAKNLYLSPSRSIFRKLKEAVTALRLETALSKGRIMDLYLSTAEWGPGIWGADAASKAYFGVRPDALRPAQAAALAPTLPHPLTSNPAYHPNRMLARRDWIVAWDYGDSMVVMPADR